MISLSHEGTDYDRAEWNLDTSDNDSVLTWGPYGATVGHGGEVQAILRRIGQRDRDILVTAFAEELGTMEQLLENANGEAVLRPVHQDGTRRRRWVQIFAALGDHAVARAEYDAHALDGETWLRRPLRRLYRGLIPDSSPAATSADYGFFLDLAMHMSISPQRIATVQSAIASRQEEVGRPLQPAERRQVVSRSLVPSMQQRDRLGRNVVFYVDAIGEQGLSEAERSPWRERTRRRASGCGLNDDEQFLPGFL